MNHFGWLCGWNVSGSCPRWACLEKTLRWEVHIKDYALEKGGEEAELTEGNWNTVDLVCVHLLSHVG